MNIKKIVDNYLIYALPLDFLIVVLIWILNIFFPIFEITYNEKGDNLDLLSNIIGASISLAGFVLASLTIIVSIRSNTKIKEPEDAENAMELFFSVGTYKTIVKVFKIAIAELIFCFITAYIIWVFSKNISNLIIHNSVISFIFLTSVSSFRSLFVMFLMINLDRNATEKS